MYFLNFVHLKSLREECLKYQEKIQDLEKRLKDAHKNITSRDALILTLEECDKKKTQEIHKLEVKYLTVLLFVAV